LIDGDDLRQQITLESGYQLMRTNRSRNSV